jgi:hypothetical protein
MDTLIVEYKLPTSAKQMSLRLDFSFSETS